MKPWCWPALCSLALLAVPAAANDLLPADFLWRATLEVPADASLVRVPLPAEGLMRLQTPQAFDVRMFDAQSQRVPFAFSAPTRPAESERRPTPAFRALPLRAAAPGGRPPRGMAQVQVTSQGAQQSLWVQLSPAGDAPPQASRLPAALFDTRAQKQPVTGLVLQASFPANAPVAVSASVSSDLATWTAVPLRGRVFRFEGENAPANDTLELAQPLALEGRYLRLDWSGHEGVQVNAVTGLVNGAEPRPQRPSAALAPPRADGDAALEWHLGFATPIAELELRTERPNTLVPVRVLGRNQPSEPWRQIGQAVVYRLGTDGQENLSPPVPLQPTSLRWLRVEATHGMTFTGLGLSARALFEPLEVVFVASGAGPYRLALGRAYTPSAALPVSMLAATTTTRVDALPLAKVVEMNSAPPVPPAWWESWMPRGIDSRAAGLWLVLAVGVAVLGGVAWSLMRQVNRPPGPR